MERKLLDAIISGIIKNNYTGTKLDEAIESIARAFHRTREEVLVEYLLKRLA